MTAPGAFIIALGTLVLGSVYSGATSACNVLNQEISGLANPKKAKLASYSESGKAGNEIDAATVLNKKVIECNETFGLVKVPASGTDTVWIDRADVVIKVAADCKKAVASAKIPGSGTRPAGTVETVSSGIDPGAKPCDEAGK
jgi:hypothetical protein